MSLYRQLSAIMFTDIEGYTSLMQRDEKQAILIRERHRKSFEELTERFNGKIIQYFGDGTLSVFKSAVEAVDCAIELQKAYLIEPKIPVRIGIHIGDILQSKDDIIGDAVNVASRIESCAVSGSILISDKVHDQIRNHRHIKVKFLDVFELKNVDEVMPIFAISNEGLVVPKREDIKGKVKKSVIDKNKTISKKKAFFVALGTFIVLLAIIFKYQNINKKESSIVNELSIAVLPFNNLSTDDDSEFFIDGINEDILTQLSKLKDLKVISRTSVIQYKNTKKTIPVIAQELGVNYILEGSIRKYGNDVRITAQLINALSDEHIWAENYDKTLDNIFMLQTEVSREIVNALQINLSFEEKERLETLPTKNFEAYKLFLNGRNEADKRNSESLTQSITLYKEAIALDSNYAEAYAEIANSIYLETYYSGRDPKEASQLAHEYLEKAEKIDDKVSRIYSVKGLINNIEGKHEEADKAFKKAIKLSPNDVTARQQYSTFFYYTKQFEKQLEQAEIAFRLDPLSFASANSYFNALMFNYKYDEAENLLKKIENRRDENNAFVINRSFFRLYMDQKKYKEAIIPLKKLVKTESAYYRFLGYCYAKTGDTIKAFNTINSIKLKSIPEEKSHQLAVVFAGLKVTDSVLFYLDTIRNNQAKKLRRENEDFFDYLQNNPKYIEILRKHGIN